MLLTKSINKSFIYFISVLSSIEIHIFVSHIYFQFFYFSFHSQVTRDYDWLHSIIVAKRLYHVVQTYQFSNLFALILISFFFFLITLQASVEVREASKRAVNQLQTSSPNLIPPSLKKDFTSSSQELSKFVHSSGGGSGGDIVETVTLKEQCEYMNTIMSTDQDTGITILHYNDVYNIDVSTSTEPIGGAARFCTAMKSFDHLEPLVLFSGDAFSPSMCKYILLLNIDNIYSIYTFKSPKSCFVFLNVIIVISI